MKASWSTNLVLKVASLLVAVLVWNFYRTEPTSIRVMTVPLQYGPPPQALALTDDPPATVLLRLEAPEVVFRDLSDRDLAARIELSNLTTGQQFIPVTQESFQVPAGAKVLRIDPDLISLNVERKLERPVVIEAETIGEVAPGYELVSVVLMPDKVRVQGPESAVRKIEKVRVGSIDITGKSETFQELVSVVTENSAVQVSEQRSVRATVNIRELPQERGFIELPVLVVNSTGLATVEPDSVGVSVSGPPSRLAELDSGSFRVVVDAAGLEPRAEPYDLVPTVGFAPPSLALVLEVRALSVETVAVSVLPAAE